MRPVGTAREALWVILRDLKGEAGRVERSPPDSSYTDITSSSYTHLEIISSWRAWNALGMCNITQEVVNHTKHWSKWIIFRIVVINSILECLIKMLMPGPPIEANSVAIKTTPKIWFQFIVHFYFSMFYKQRIILIRIMLIQLHFKSLMMYCGPTGICLSVWFVKKRTHFTRW